MSAFTRSRLLLVILAAVLVQALAGSPARAQTFLLDTFEDDPVGQPPNGPEIGHYVTWGTSGHTVVDVGGDKWCRTTTPPATGNLIGWEPMGSASGRFRLSYTFLVENGINLTAANAISHAITMLTVNPIAQTISISWGDDLKIRLGATEIGTFAVGASYDVVWNVDTEADTFDLWINGQQIVTTTSFPVDVTALRELSIGSNFDTVGSYRYDDVLGTQGPLFADGFESGDASAWSSVIPPLAGGDECTEPLVLASGTPRVGDLGNNTGTTGDDSSCGSGDTIDEWLELTAPCTGTLTVSTCRPGTEFDTVLSAFGTCGGAELACNDDDPVGSRPECSLGGLNRKSTITFPVTAGGTYRVRVSVYLDSFPSPAETDYEVLAGCAP